MPRFSAKIIKKKHRKFEDSLSVSNGGEGGGGGYRNFSFPSATNFYLGSRFFIFRKTPLQRSNVRFYFPSDLFFSCHSFSATLISFLILHFVYYALTNVVLRCKLTSSWSARWRIEKVLIERWQTDFSFFFF